MDDALTKSKTLFDHLDAILKYKDKNYYKSLSEVDKKTWSLYMINRFISMEYENVIMVNDLDASLNSVDISPEHIYNVYMNIFPAKKYRSKYIKAENLEKYSTELINTIKEYFSISKREAIEYIDLYKSMKDGVEQLKAIIAKYGYTDKEINKILKG